MKKINKKQKPDTIKFNRFDDPHTNEGVSEVCNRLGDALSRMTPMELLTLVNVFEISIHKQKNIEWDNANTKVHQEKNGGEVVEVSFNSDDTPDVRLRNLLTSLQDEVERALGMIDTMRTMSSMIHEQDIDNITLTTEEVADA